EKYNLRQSDIFTDKATGKNFERVNWKRLRAEIKENDLLIISSIDRLSRNKQEALSELRSLQADNIRVVIDDIPSTSINTTELTSSNKAMIEMMNNILIEVYTTLAQEELERTKSRQKAGYEALKRDEKNRMISSRTQKAIGRENKQENLTKEQKRYIKAWLDSSIKLADCIKFAELSRATLYRIKKNMEVK
ncbi:MAG: recombinase family protein, partial [Cetobacterium sp.]